jgi:hypothetical protein
LESWQTYLLESAKWRLSGLLEYGRETPAPWITEYEDVVEVFETIESPGPGELYTECDGIPRFRRLGPPTTTLSRLVSVTQPSYSRRYKINAESGTTKTEFDTSTWVKKPLTFPPPTCHLHNSQTVCLPNATDTSTINVDDVDNTIAIHGSCQSPNTECEMEFAHDEVVLIYWPSNVSNVSRDICAPSRTFTAANETRVNSRRIAILPAITFRGQDLYRLGRSTSGRSFGRPKHIGTSVMNGPFTFTSPTHYLAHHPLTFTFWDGNGFNFTSSSLSVRPSGIIELHPTNVISHVPKITSYKNDIEYARRVANGEFMHHTPYVHEDYTPFNFDDLQDPVPARTYFDARYEDCWGRQSHCRTITDDSYRPRLAIWRNIFGVPQSGKYTCYVPELVDPPIALTPLVGEFQGDDDSPLPFIPRGSSQVDWVVAASATATDTCTPLGTGLPAEPRPIPTKLWPFPTATSSSISGSLRDDNAGPGLRPRGSLKGTDLDSTGEKRQGHSHCSATIFTSGSPKMDTEFMVKKWIISLNLCLFCITIISS